MTLYQFNSLDDLEQWETMLNHGVIIGSRIDESYRIELYQIFSFYIELYYHIENDVLHRLRSFSNTECLDAYLSQFTLKELE